MASAVSAPSASFEAVASRNSPSTATLSAGPTPVSHCSVNPPASSAHSSENVRIRSMRPPRAGRARAGCVRLERHHTGRAAGNRRVRRLAWLQPAALTTVVRVVVPATHRVLAVDGRHGVTHPGRPGLARQPLERRARQSAAHRRRPDLAIRHPRLRRRVDTYSQERQCDEECFHNPPDQPGRAATYPACPTVGRPV